MKRCVVMLLIACALVLCACRSVEQQPTVGVGASPTTNGQTTAPTMTTQPTEPTQPTDPTLPTEPTQPLPSTPADELAVFNALFGDLGSWHNLALVCEYADPSQIRLENLFYLGFEGESREPTDAEWEQQKDQPAFRIEMDLMRLPVDRMNQVLTEQFGITLEDIDDAGFENLVYLESTNCYYHMVTDAWVTEYFNAVTVENLEDGTVRVTYTAGLDNSVFVVTVKPYGDGYRLLSNVRAE